MISKKVITYLTAQFPAQAEYYTDMDKRFQDFSDADIGNVLRSLKEPSISAIIERLITGTDDKEVRAHLLGYENEFEQQMMIAKLERMIKEIRDGY